MVFLSEMWSSFADTLVPLDSTNRPPGRPNNEKPHTFDLFHQQIFIIIIVLMFLGY